MAPDLVTTVPWAATLPPQDFPRPLVRARGQWAQLRIAHPGFGLSKFFPWAHQAPATSLLVLSPRLRSHTASITLPSTRWLRSLGFAVHPKELSLRPVSAAICCYAQSHPWEPQPHPTISGARCHSSLGPDYSSVSGSVPAAQLLPLPPLSMPSS